MNAADHIGFVDLVEGQTREHTYIITPQVYFGFLAAFDDRSPIHTSDEFAAAHGFKSLVMHGGILNGFVSHFVGMVFPGSSSLLLSSDIRFHKPSYLGDSLRLSARVSQKLETMKVIVLHVSFQNLTQDCMVASGRLQIKVE